MQLRGANSIPAVSHSPHRQDVRMDEREYFLTLLGLQMNGRNYASRSFIQCASYSQSAVWNVFEP